MDQNQNPPSEREWSVEEREAFFSSVDAITGLPNSAMAGTPINTEPFHPIPRVHNCGDELAKEQEKFLAQQSPKISEALDRLLSGVPNQPPIEWSTGAWNGPLIELDPNDPFSDMERQFNRGIHVTSIIPPEQGWPMGFHCPICRETTFLLSLYAAKPRLDEKEYDGYHILDYACASEEHGDRHNMEMAMVPLRGKL